MESDTPTEPLWPDLAEVNVRLRAELAAAIKQRDEAQKEVCEMIARTRRKTGIRGQIVGLDRVTPAEIAVERGWDCFKEGGGK